MMHGKRNITGDSVGRGYLPIEEYGVIGNLRTVVLVGNNGSIDWCCFPELGGPSVFAAILDADRGGRFRVAPVLNTGPDGSAGSKSLTRAQEYLPDTNILLTRFRDNGDDQLILTDFMPLQGDIEGTGGSRALPEIHRLLYCPGRQVEIELVWAPRFDYARGRARISRSGGGFIAAGKTGSMSLSAVPGAEIEESESGQSVRARFILTTGEHMVLVTRWDSDSVDAAPEVTRSLLVETGEVWRQWVKGRGVSARNWAGEWLDYVNRSSLVFKLLTNADTGAVAAAATTSLPENIGGVRNWDYRYAWIRDASMTAQALFALGHEKDASALFHWMEDISMKHEEGLDLRVMYGLHGEDNLREVLLDHLEGYRGSRPVRIGNEAAKQFQLEVYGELVNSAYEMARRGKVWDQEIKRFICHLADETCRLWELPDFGIWEMRSGPDHFTYSKVMAWVAPDRAITLTELYGFAGDADKWLQACGEIREQVLAHGYSERLGAFVMTFDSEDLDAALLRIPLMEFLPVDDPRVEGTINLIMKQLMTGDLVYRYRRDDGLPGDEGVFGLCTFWLVDVLTLAGRIEEAERIFRGMLGHASRLGLFAEEIDPETATFLGNYPQAFTHIGLINSALYLAWAHGKAVPDHAPIGTQKHRGQSRAGNRF
ncbi:MAG: glycoside hydrolase family 15 protein [Desulfobulbaceae bacterium]|nr:glycoside hydrolase family 15 protein [Desulfobulbaceae bacterium]